LRSAERDEGSAVRLAPGRHHLDEACTCSCAHDHWLQQAAESLDGWTKSARPAASELTISAATPMEVDHDKCLDL